MLIRGNFYFYFRRSVPCNYNLTDLSDPKQPTEIAEKMSELYDNQWTDAFDVLEQTMDETDIIRSLLRIVMVRERGYMVESKTISPM